MTIQFIFPAIYIHDFTLLVFNVLVQERLDRLPGMTYFNGHFLLLLRPSWVNFSVLKYHADERNNSCFNGRRNSHIVACSNLHFISKKTTFNVS